MILMAMLLAISTPAPAVAKPSRIEANAAAVERAGAALEPHIEGTWLDGKPGTDRLAEAQWRAVQNWAADWLDSHPHASAEALAKAGMRFGDSWSISAVGLGRGDILVSVSRYPIGNAFILGPGGPGGYRVLWSAAAPQTRLNPAADRALALWRPVIQNRHCGDCRMISVSSAGRLPNAADGATRFWIEAGYAQVTGGTIGEQLSLWSWQNGRARPLLVSDFAVVLDQAGPVLRGSTLHVPSKGGWNSVGACGGCSGRVTDLRFAIGPTGVRALPPVSLTPEIDLVDRVFSRVLARQQVGVIASASVLRTVRRQLGDRLAESDPQMKKYAGMLMGWKRWRVRGERWACLDVDGAGATAFAFDRSLTRIVSAQILEPNACQGKDARM
ncbi:MAG: hypothetical protein ABI471_09945 [Sphingomonas bacterium]